MTFAEALQHLLFDKKVQRPHWGKGNCIHMDIMFHDKTRVAVREEEGWFVEIYSFPLEDALAQDWVVLD